MRTLLYNPIFINPQAYYVFPRLTRYLQPDNESTAEPANYIGTIEVRVIAYGDTNLVRTYTNTSEIDLSEFKNTYIRISLFTKIGSCVLGEWKVGGIKEDIPYIDPEVLESLRAVVVVDNKSNYDKDRATITNLVDPDNPFIASNFAWKANSGYGKYEIDFDTWIKSNKITSTNSESFNFTTDATWALLYYKSDIGKDMPSFKVHIKLEGEGKVYYNYVNSEGVFVNDIITQEEYVTPISYNTKYTGETPVNCGFSIAFISDKVSGTITQIPSFQGALVTNGVDDLITSSKTVQEMLGGSNEITVVSMIHKMSSDNNWSNLIGELKRNHTFVANTVINTDKTGIYGYTYNYNENAIVINNILGDKNDYIVRTATSLGLNNKYYVTGFENVGTIQGVSQLAWYWTIIANKVLTTDQINQVIAYYNLDKYVKPYIYYDVKKQGLSNNTPDADWYLKDFSGNGRDMQLYNFAKKLGSGVGKYEADYSTWNKHTGITSTPFGFKITGEISSNYWLVYTYNTTIPAHKVKVSGIPEGGELRYANESIKLENGINELPEMEAAGATGFTINLGTTQLSDWTGLSVEQIPDYEGALVFDAVEDYGQFVGDLGLKDYTVAVDRAYVKAKGSQVPIISNATNLSDSTPFIMEYLSREMKVASNSFGVYTTLSELNINRFISYQNTYKYGSTNITRGTSTDTGSGLTIGRKFGTSVNYCNIALWSLLLFPYSLSEFLLERQLKRYKLGTLYPDMIEFRPIITGNVPYKSVEIHQGSTILYSHLVNNTGTYISKDEPIRIFIGANGADIVSSITVNGVTKTDLKQNANGKYWANFPITKSPQKIDYTIDEYIRYEDIVQSYPAIVNLRQSDKNITWGDKLKVGSEVTFVNHTNLLPDLYTISGAVQYNGTFITWNTPIRVEKSMVFTNIHGYKKDNEPNCILSPQTLRIPNASYKILGYIPDLTGKGNHGVFNNFAFTEESGVNEDGSIHFDGVDDFITIPTLASGAKQVLMKVNYKLHNDYCTIYDQRNPSVWKETFCIYSNNESIAYSIGNSGKTYIDGILNTYIKSRQLANITHNITIANEDVTNANSISPKIGTLLVNNSAYAQMALFTFMSFPEISSEDEIKELNDIVGIEGGYVESPDYYWDAYGKANRATQDIDYLDLNQAGNAHQVLIDKSKAGLAALELYHNTGNVRELNNRRLVANNFAFNEESGYVDNGLVSDGVEDHLINTVIPEFNDFTVITKRKFLNTELKLNECFCMKGDKSYLGGVGNAFVMEYFYGSDPTSKQTQMLSFGGQNTAYREESDITWCTPTSYNNITINRGEGGDTVGLSIGKYSNVYWKGVFYKMMLYSKTIDMLSINMLKNLFERDELINVKHPIFKK